MNTVPKAYSETTLLQQLGSLNVEPSAPASDFIFIGGINVQTQNPEIAKAVLNRLTAIQLKKGSGYCLIDDGRVYWHVKRKDVSQ